MDGERGKEEQYNKDLDHLQEHRPLSFRTRKNTELQNINVPEHLVAMLQKNRPENLVTMQNEQLATMEQQNVLKDFQTMQNVQEHLRTMEQHNVPQISATTEQQNMLEYLTTMEQQNVLEHLTTMEQQNEIQLQHLTIMEKQKVLQLLHQYLATMKQQKKLNQILETIEQRNVSEHLKTVEQQNVQRLHHSITTEQQKILPQLYQYLANTGQNQNVLELLEDLQQQNLLDQYLTTTDQQNLLNEYLAILKKHNILEKMATIEQQNVPENLATMRQKNMLQPQHLETMEQQNVLQLQPLETMHTLPEYLATMKQLNVPEQLTTIEQQNDPENLATIGQQNMLQPHHSATMKQQNTAEQLTTIEQQNIAPENLASTEEDDSDHEMLELRADPWKIKKQLQDFDLKYRLLVLKRQAERHVLPVLQGSREQIDNGCEVDIWDVDTKTKHSLLFQKRSKSYVFTGNWKEDFAKRRDLKLYDTVGLYWDTSNKRFNFSVLLKNRRYRV